MAIPSKSEWNGSDSAYEALYGHVTSGGGSSGGSSGSSGGSSGSSGGSSGSSGGSSGGGSSGGGLAERVARRAQEAASRQRGSSVDSPHKETREQQKKAKAKAEAKKEKSGSPSGDRYGGTDLYSRGDKSAGIVNPDRNMGTTTTADGTSQDFADDVDAGGATSVTDPTNGDTYTVTASGVINRNPGDSTATNDDLETTGSTVTVTSTPSPDNTPAPSGGGGLLDAVGSPVLLGAVALVAVAVLGGGD